MPQLHPSWQLSLTSAAGLIVVHVAARRWGRRLDRPALMTTAAFARESAVIMLLLGLWQFVGGLVLTRVAGATERARAIHAWEADWYLANERVVQSAVDAVPHLSHLADLYYAYAHLNGMAVFVGWLWWRHRDIYPRARAVLVHSTLACLVVQSVPVAPPRLLPELGFVDTALRDGTSVYGQFGDGMANQLAAMPSVHVGWAAIIGWYVWWSASRRWRWIGPVHTALTALVVVATANHWWLDGVVAAGFVALAIGARALVSPEWRSRRTSDENDSPARPPHENDSSVLGNVSWATCQGTSERGVSEPVLVRATRPRVHRRRRDRHAHRGRRPRRLPLRRTGGAGWWPAISPVRTLAARIRTTSCSTREGTRAVTATTPAHEAGSTQYRDAGKAAPGRGRPGQGEHETIQGRGRRLA